MVARLIIVEQRWGEIMALFPFEIDLGQCWIYSWASDDEGKKQILTLFIFFKNYFCIILSWYFFHSAFFSFHFLLFLNNIIFIILHFPLMTFLPIHLTQIHSQFQTEYELLFSEILARLLNECVSWTDGLWMVKANEGVDVHP